MNRRAWPVIGVLLLSLGFASAGSAATSLDLTQYQDSEGAVTVHAEGDFVDPYFANQAFLIGLRYHIDDRVRRQRWIAWLVARQRADGRFERFCHDSAGWTACQAADADDSALALWIELLARGDTGLTQPAEVHSLELALTALLELYDPKLGGYRVSRSEDHALLMDNCEVASAWLTLAQRRMRERQAHAALRDRRRALDVVARIPRTFAPGTNGLARVSTENGTTDSFYPARVAHLFPAYLGLTLNWPPGTLTESQWMDRFAGEWLGQSGDVFPWGLLALAALNRGDRLHAACWRSNAAKLRGGERWNISEEVVWQVLGERGYDTNPSCLTGSST